MSLVLQPQASFTVVRQIANHTDSGTYYVRAVIRNAYTDDLLENLNLTDRGSQRFSKNWQVPADTSGQGFYISIVTSVYTDSGYTTKSENYGDEENTYLVQERVLPLMRGGGGGVDAYTVRRIFKEELAKLPTPEPFPKIDIPADRTDEVLKAIKANKPEKQEKVNLAPVLTKLTDIKKAIADKEVTPAADLAPIIEALETSQEALREEIPTKVEEIFKNVTLTIQVPTEANVQVKKPQSERSPIDIKSLTL